MNIKFLLIIFSVLLFSSVYAEQQSNTDKPKVIVLAPHIVEMLYSIGAGEQIIATSEHSDYPPAAKKIPRIGNYARLQIEKIVQLQPDYVIAWKSGNPSDDLQRLQSLGIQIKYSQPNKLEDLAKELITFGQLLGRAEQANEVAENYLTRLKQLKQKYQDKKPVSIFYELWSQPITTIANNAWPQQVIEICQINNPFKQAQSDYPQVSMEKIITSQPQIIIQPHSSGVAMQNAIQWSMWTGIPAVLNEKILSPDADQLHRMTPRMLDELESLCEKIDDIRNYYEQ